MQLYYYICIAVVPAKAANQYQDPIVVGSVYTYRKTGPVKKSLQSKSDTLNKGSITLAFNR